VLSVVTAVVIGLTGVIVAVRADGFAAFDATVPRATRWFVDQANGRVVLADGFSGRALARLNTSADGQVLEVAQSASGAVIVDRSAATARTIDSSALRLGPRQSVGLVAEPTTVIGVSQAGLVAVDPVSAQGLLLPTGGDAVPFDIDTGATTATTQIARDGAVWTIAGGRLSRFTTTGRQTIVGGLAESRFTLVGGSPLILDVSRGRVQFGAGDWIDMPADVAIDELVLQAPGPAASCGWIGGDDRLWCVDEHGFAESVTVGGLDVDGADTLAIAGDAAALVRRSPSEIVRFDWREGEILDDAVADPSAGASLEVSASTDLVWVDETNGDFVWAVNPWGVTAISKDDQATPLLGEAGELLADGTGGQVPSVRGGEDRTGDAEREPDNNGIDDPPVAIDDPVTARSGTSVPIAVTANDYDPDGEAIALTRVGTPRSGKVEIADASTVLYQPNPGYVGIDEFEYTIVDGDGTEATATVSIELLPVDAPNQAPIGAPDVTETGPDAPVTIDVLLNDIDPERDALRVASFNPPDVGGRISETVAPSGLPALRYEPPAGASGTATFTYRPVDSFGAVGEPVVVQDNRPPIVKPDAARVRRDVVTQLPVLSNDRDPDGDRLTLGLVQPTPPGLDVRVNGFELEVIARAGAAELSPLSYTVDDGNGHVVTGSVLIVLIGEEEPNRPPVANADTASAVAGTAQLIDVLANDRDPDGDPLILVDVQRADDVPNAGAIAVQGSAVLYTAAPIATDEDIAIDRFTYTITDGNGASAVGEVSVRVLPEAIAAPPFAQDDAATTEVDVPVTLDVLRNDGDPSGERPTIVGTPGCAGGGRAIVTPDAKVTFVPPPGRSGVFTCVYEVRNSQELRDDATIVVSVLEPEVTNRPPIVNNEEVTVHVGETVTIEVLANDSDPDGPQSELRVLSSTRPSLGTATRTGNVIVFDAGNAIGDTSITYRVGDATTGVSIGRVVIHIVDPEPVAPFANDDARTITGPATPTTIAVLSNDGDPDGDVRELRVSGAAVLSGDAAITIDNASVTISPDPDYIGDVVVRYTIVDPDGLTAEARIVLTVLEAPNRPPVAGDDAATVSNGGTVSIPIALNDLDLDGDPLTYSIVTAPDPALGSARLESGALVFVGVPDASGTATVVYRVDDGEATDDAVVTITVLPCTQSRPSAPDLFFQTGYQQPIAIDLTATASNGTVVDVGPPLSAPSGVYTPPAGENGNVTFTYTVRNACRVQAVGTVVIDVNQEPLASTYQTSMGRREQIVIPVSALATDAEPLRIVGWEGLPDWITVIDEQRALSVNPAGRSGRVDMTIIVADPGGLQARVPVTIDLVNLAPVAQPDTVAIADAPVVVSPLANDSDPDGDPISLGAVPVGFEFSNGATGTIQTLGNGQLRIDAGAGLGVGTFQYTIVDSLGLTSAPVTVTVTVNRSPVAPTVPIDVNAGSSVTVPVPATDAEGGPLTLTIIGDPSPLRISVDGLTVTVTAPLLAVLREFSVGYRVTDPQGATATGTLQIKVRLPLPTTTTTTTTTSTSTTTTTITTTVPPTTSTSSPTSSSSSSLP
jgi:Bacterial Ig domain